jgi:ribonuclease HI
MHEKNYSVEIYTDGSCLKNPGIGGFGFLILDHFNKNLYIMSKYYEDTTNNQMEMLSCVFALKYCLYNLINENLKDKKVLILTDSQYLKNGINDWISKWKKNNWKTAANSPVKNQSIWMEIDYLNEKIRPNWLYVKAHADNPYNNFVDKIANLTSKTQRELNQFEINKVFSEFFSNNSINSHICSFEKRIIL